MKYERRKARRPFAGVEAAVRRRARLNEASGSHTDAEWIVLCIASAWRCDYCGHVLDEKTATRDHAIPLSRGGSDDISNIVVACKSCNSKKHARTSEEFALRRA